MDFFRPCPECGARFHVKLVDKKLVHLERESSTRTMSPRNTSVQFRGSGALAVQESRPVRVDVADFEYAYKCGHCGHEWTEKQTKERQEN